MANTSQQTTWKNVLIFWVKVLVICLILGIVSFYIGRSYLGSMIADTTVQDGSPEIVAEIAEEQPPQPEGANAPPEKAQVEVYERDPSEKEAKTATEEYVLVDGRDDEEGTGDADEGDDSGADADETAEETSETAQTQEAENDELAPASDSGGEGSEGGSYVVIAGSFVDLKNAEQQVQELREEGYDPFITQVPIGEQMYSRVNVATYSSREKAEALTEVLQRKGYEVRVGVH